MKTSAPNCNGTDAAWDKPGMAPPVRERPSNISGTRPGGSRQWVGGCRRRTSWLAWSIAVLANPPTGRQHQRRAKALTYRLRFGARPFQIRLRVGFGRPRPRLSPPTTQRASTSVLATWTTAMRATPPTSGSCAADSDFGRAAALGELAAPIAYQSLRGWRRLGLHHDVQIINPGLPPLLATALGQCEEPRRRHECRHGPGLVPAYHG